MPTEQRTSEIPAPSVPNLSFVEDLYYAWRDDPTSVGEPWRRYFESLPEVPGSAPAPAEFPRRRPDGARSDAAPAASEAAFQAKVDRLVQAYREFGHLRADLDPLGVTQRAEKLLPASFGLGDADLDRRSADPGGGGTLTLRELVARLEETYCRTLGVETAHIHDADLRDWLQQRMERTRNR
ncbi:MAG TPA: hypothetical protein VIW03_09860 [Anaeromyxobacter sp.]